MRDAQRGHLELDGKYKLVDYNSFKSRFKDLEFCLTVSRCPF